MSGPATDELRAVVRARFAASMEAPGAFFDRRASDLARACLDLASIFHRGGRLLVVGTGAAASDALHVSVEFVHPVIVGKRALPALALTDSPGSRLRALVEPDDMVLVLTSGAAPSDQDGARAALAAVRDRAAGTIAMVGAGAEGWDADHVFAVESDDPLVVQEVHETAYHVLWELVHVFLDHPQLLDHPQPRAPVCHPDPVTGRCATCADEALEGRVLRVGDDSLADVEVGGGVRTVAVELIEGVRPGDVVLVHAGVAIGRLEA